MGVVAFAVRLPQNPQRFQPRDSISIASKAESFHNSIPISSLFMNTNANLAASSYEKSSSNIRASKETLSRAFKDAPVREKLSGERIAVRHGNLFLRFAPQRRIVGSNLREAVVAPGFIKVQMQKGAAIDG